MKLNFFGCYHCITFIVISYNANISVTLCTTEIDKLKAIMAGQNMLGDINLTWINSCNNSHSRYDTVPMERYNAINSDNYWPHFT